MRILHIQRVLTWDDSKLRIPKSCLVWFLIFFVFLVFWRVELGLFFVVTVWNGIFEPAKLRPWRKSQKTRLYVRRKGRGSIHWIWKGHETDAFYQRERCLPPKKRNIIWQLTAMENSWMATLSLNEDARKLPPKVSMNACFEFARLCGDWLVLI